MPAVAVDTHIILWYLTKSPSLSRTAESVLDQASVEGYPIYVPSICLVELTYLVEKARLPASARQILTRALVIRMAHTNWRRSTALSPTPWNWSREVKYRISPIGSSPQPLLRCVSHW
jgi:PIN domain nuclease of toxin-antitoxin system